MIYELYVLEIINLLFYLTCILGRIAFAAKVIPPIRMHFCIAWSVGGLSVICHIHDPFLSHSLDLDATWQIHLWDAMTHCFRWGSLTPQEDSPGRGEIWGPTYSQTFNCCCHLVNTYEDLDALVRAISPFAKLHRSLFRLVLTGTCLQFQAGQTAELSKIFRA